MINAKKEVFLKNFFLFLCVFGQQKNRTNEAGEAQKAQDTALKAADSKKRRTLSKARGIGAEMSCRRRDGAGQSGSFASVKAQARCPAGARARKIDLSITAEFVMVKAGVYE